MEEEDKLGTNSVFSKSLNEKKNALVNRTYL